MIKETISKNSDFSLFIENKRILTLTTNQNFFVMEKVKMKFLVSKYGHMVKWIGKCVQLHILKRHANDLDK